MHANASTQRGKTYFHDFLVVEKKRVEGGLAGGRLTVLSWLQTRDGGSGLDQQ